MLIFQGLIYFHLHKPPAGSPAVKAQPSYFMILQILLSIVEMLAEKRVAQRCLEKVSDNQGHDVPVNCLFAMSCYAWILFLWGK